MKDKMLIIELIHKHSINIDMLKLYRDTKLYRRCFYCAINNNLSIVDFIRLQGLKPYNIRAYKTMSCGKEKETPMQKKKRNHMEKRKYREQMIYSQRQH